MKRRARLLQAVRRGLLAALLGVASHAAPPASAGDDAVALPPPRLEGELTVEGALAARRSVRAFAAKPLSLNDVAQLLWAAQGITGPDGGRTAPSAGALYPLEVHLLASDVGGLPPGLYRYDPRAHRLLPGRRGDLRAAVVAASLDQDWMADAPAMLVLAGVYERSARKYGRRAPRYVHMEMGHAAQNVYLQAGALGLGTTIVGAFRDDALARAIGLPAGQRPLGLMPVGPPR